MSVALIKRDNYTNPIKSAIELCSGFGALKPDHNVLIKPNLVMGADKKLMPPFGKVTTARVIVHLIQALLYHNCSKITIGEGAVVMPELGSDTRAGNWSEGSDRARSFPILCRFILAHWTSRKFQRLFEHPL